MKTFFIMVIFFLYMCTSGSRAIKCYVCDGKGSSCKGGNGTCPASANRCFKAVSKTGKTMVRAECATSFGCNITKLVCERSKACEAYCCSTDFCNASPGVLMVAIGTLVFSLSAGLFMNN